MIETFLEQLQTLYSRMKKHLTGRFLLFVSGISLIVVSTVALPYLWNPYVRIPGRLLQLQLDCVPYSVEVRTPNRYASITSASISVRTGRGLGIGLGRWEYRPIINHGVMTLTLDDDAYRSLGKILESASDPKTQLDVQFARVMAIDIDGVTLVRAVKPATHICAARELEGDALLKAQLSGLASIKKIVPPQEAISDFVLDNNDTIVNAGIGSMFIAVLYLISILADGWRRLYITSDRKLQIETAERALQVPEKLQKEGNAAVLRADFARLCRRLMFAKTLGPVVGFALTVSSLIAALHPAVQADRDSLRFLSSLQLALVSTLVGLAMRIVAEFAIRMHRTATEQAVALEEIDSSSEKTS